MANQPHDRRVAARDTMGAGIRMGSPPSVTADERADVRAPLEGTRLRLRTRGGGRYALPGEDASGLP